MFRSAPVDAPPAPAPPRRTARATLLLLHRWAGLLLGLVLAALGASGAVLSWQRELDAALHPALFRASGPADPAIGFAAILRRAEAEGLPVGSIRPPDATWPVWVVAPPRGAREALTATYDPATGALLGERDPRAGLVGWARELHEHLLLRGRGGRELVGWLGVPTLLFCLTGLWLWWPRGGGLGAALVRLRRRPAVVLNLDLHRLVGAWSAAVLAVVALSGIAIVFPDWFRPLLGIPAPAVPAPSRAAPRAVGGPDADAIVAAALAHVPGQVVTGLAPPGRAWTVTLRPAGSDPEVRGRTFVTLDAATGAVSEERGPRTRGAAEDALALQRWLHGGALLGLPGRWLVFLAGLAMPLFFVTGLAAWLLRRRRRPLNVALARSSA